MASQVALAGWPAFEWGRLGPGPKPAVLDPLIMAGVSTAALEELIDALFQLSPAVSHPRLLAPYGGLRPFVRSAFASQVMYFEERVRYVVLWGIVLVVRGNGWDDAYVCMIHVRRE